MTKVATLISQIKGKLPAKIQTRVTKLENLEKDLAEATALNTAEPSQVNQDAVDELNGLVTEISDSIAVQLEAIIVEEAKTPPQVIDTNANPAPSPALEPAPAPAPIPEPLEEPKKSKSGWWVAAAVGGLLATVTAIFIMRPKE